MKGVMKMPGTRREILVGALLAVASLAATAADTLATRFGWFGTLAGSCWKAEHADGKGSDVQCFEAQYGRFIRGTGKVYEGTTLLVETDSLFAVDPASRRIVFTQWASNGNFGTGVITVENATFLTFEPQPPAPGKPEIRYQWLKTDADSFRATRQRHEGPNWVEESAVVYRRQGGRQ